MSTEKGIKFLGSFMNARRRLEQATDLNNLTKGEYLVLRRIKMERDENEVKNITMFKAIKISEHLGMPPPGVSRILNLLEKRKLIERIINKDNRRCIIISLTEKGRLLLDEAEKQISVFAANLCNELGEDNTTLLVNLLNKVSDYCEKLNSEKDNLDG